MIKSVFVILMLFSGSVHAASDLVFQNELQAVAMKEKSELQVVAPDNQSGATENKEAKSPAKIDSGTDAKIDAKVGTELDEASLLITNIDEPNESLPAETATAAKASVPQNESDIPVKLDAKADAKAADASLRDMLLAFALLFGFAGLAYLGLRKLKNRNPKTSQFQMKVLSQHHLGPKKSLVVVRVAGESVLIGVTDHHISMIKSLALLDEDIPEEVPQTEFGNFFRTASKNKIAEIEADSADSEDFAISKIRDVVTRQVRQLKSLE